MEANYCVYHYESIAIIFIRVHALFVIMHLLFLLVIWCRYDGEGGAL